MRVSRIIVVALIVLSAATATFAQSAAENVMNVSAYWKHKATQFVTLPNPENEICFLGDSITDGSEWRELTGDPRVTNRGIGGDTSWGVLARITEVTEGKPAKVFLMIGTNDLAWGGESVARVSANIAKLLDTIKTQSPATEIYLQSVLPVREDMRGDTDLFKNAKIDPLNAELIKIAAAKKITFVDLRPLFKDGEGKLKRELTEDGLHINGAAYYLWYGAIRKYFED